LEGESSYVKFALGVLGIEIPGYGWISRSAKMIVRSSRYLKPRAALLAVGAVLLTTAQDCGQIEYYTVHYELTSCPGQGFALPDSAREGGHVLKLPTATTIPQPKACPAFKVYDLWEGSRCKAERWTSAEPRLLLYSEDGLPDFPRKTG
jgi:hypothetical protein